MRVKKHPSGNEYIRAGDVWVRNFTKDCITQVQITRMFDKADYALVLKNHELNKNHPKISNEAIYFENLVIVSDGHDFAARHLFLRKLPRGTGILAVNRAALKWGLLRPAVPAAERRTVNALVVNNPYRECAACAPAKDAKYYPACIASVRTNHEFLKRYGGDVYTYAPTPDETFGVGLAETYYVDDYRNPVCAAVGLAHRFGAKRVMLVCCDDSFPERRPSSVPLPNGLHAYPQHLKAQEIIDANLYWLTHQEGREVRAADYSSGAEYRNAAYIRSDEEALAFFGDQEEGARNVK